MLRGIMHNYMSFMYLSTIYQQVNLRIWSYCQQKIMEKQSEVMSKNIQVQNDI